MTDPRERADSERTSAAPKWATDWATPRIGEQQFIEQHSTGGEPRRDAEGAHSFHDAPDNPASNALPEGQGQSRVTVDSASQPTPPNPLDLTPVMERLRVLLPHKHKAIGQPYGQPESHHVIVTGIDGSECARCCAEAIFLSAHLLPNPLDIIEGCADECEGLQYHGDQAFRATFGTLSKQAQALYNAAVCEAADAIRALKRKYGG